MTFATESARSGREPVTVVELDLDFCTKVADTVDVEDTTATYNDNLIQQAEELDTTWAASGGASVASDALTPPDGVETTWKMTDAGSGGGAKIQQSVPASVLTDNLAYTISAYVKHGDNTDDLSVIATNSGGVLDIDYQWTGDVLSVKTETTGTGSVTSVGDDWYRLEAKIPTSVIDGSAVMLVNLFVTQNGTTPAGAVFDYWTGVQLEQTTAATEYQPTEARDGTSTNIRVTTGGMTIAAHASKDAIIGVEGSLTVYPMSRNGAAYVRVTGDASGEGALTPLAIASTGSTGCRATEAADSKCYNTRSTCNALIDWEATTQTHRFSEPRTGIPPTADALPVLNRISIAPTRIVQGKGLGMRAQVSLSLQDFPHHDRGIDPYVTERTYTPQDQGTYFGKLLARHVFYQGREMRVKVGYIGVGGWDLANDFDSRTYVIENISLPGNEKVTIIGKDILKLADDERAVAPTANTGVLDADINTAVTSATLSPAGIGASEYAASGTLRIGSEVCTFTRVADALTIVRGTDGTTASTHTAADSVQECLRYTEQEVQDVIEDLLLNFASVPAAYLPTTDWETEVETKLGPHDVTGLVTEPTGVTKLINELCESYLLYVWWDERDEEVNLAVISPYSAAPTVLTDDANIVKDSVSVRELPEQRRSEIWTHYGVIDPTENLTEPKNFSTVKVIIDTDAESAAEYDQVRVERRFSRWITNSGDALRLNGRLLSSVRNNPRLVRFKLNAKDNGNWTGSIITLDTDALQDVAGANEQTTLRILETKDLGGHEQECVAIDENFDGRYARIAPEAQNDYDTATADEKRRYAFIAEDTGDKLNGDGAYKVG